MSTLLKNILIVIASIILGVLVFLCLVKFAIPEDSGLGGIAFAGFYLIISMGGIIPVFYWFLRKKFLPFKQKIIDDTQIQHLSWGNWAFYIFIGIVLYLLQGQFFTGLRLYDLILGWVGASPYFIRSVGTVGNAVAVLGLFYYPFILTRPISSTKKIIFCVLFFFSPIIIALILH